MQLERLLSLSLVAQPWWFRAVTAPLAWLYRFALGCRALAYAHGFLRQEHLPALCLSVGNLTLGGTGKSPLVLALLAYLVARGERPAVLSRGYGSGLKSDEGLVFFEQQCYWAPARPIYADEARMQAAAFPTVPIIVGAKRWALAQRFLAEMAYKPSVYLLDDGFQHTKLRRDLDLVLLDAERPFGNEALLPRGRLRELPSALKRADLILVSRCESLATVPGLPERLRALTPAPMYALPFRQAWPQALQAQGPAFGPELQPALVVLGLAAPEQFLQGLKEQGIEVGACLIFRDHARLDRQRIEAELEGQRCLLTSAKDYWRDPAVFANFPLPVFIVPLSVCLPEAALTALARLLDQVKFPS